jgi:hypothetical protein
MSPLKYRDTKKFLSLPSLQRLNERAEGNNIVSQKYNCHSESCFVMVSEDEPCREEESASGVGKISDALPDDVSLHPFGISLNMTRLSNQKFIKSINHKIS